MRTLGTSLKGEREYAIGGTELTLTCICVVGVRVVMLLLGRLLGLNGILYGLLFWYIWWANGFFMVCALDGIFEYFHLMFS